MGFRKRIDLHIPDQSAPNALTAEQQDVIDRFRRDIIGAETAVVSIADDDAGPDLHNQWKYDIIFQSGSVARAPHAP